jgi:NitT/TauT family transport system substrate-binding protein
MKPQAHLLEVTRPVRPFPAAARATFIAALAFVVAACGTGASRSPGTPSAQPESVAPNESTEPSAAPVALTVGLGYIPNVQFAQFYLAQQSGAYADAGLDVTLQNKIDPDLITLLGQGAVDIGSGDGTSVIPAVSQGIPVVYTATIYGKFPSIVLARADSGITKAADLRGKKIGIPGKYGSSWIMLQALLQSGGLTPADVDIVEFPDFGQAAALQQGAVDAATGFANNEPIQLRKAGIEPVILTVDDIVPLPGPGLVTGKATLETKRDALGAFTLVTLNAMDEIAADPQKGLDATFAAVPDLAKDPELQRQILDATIATWQNPRTDAYGAIDRDGWQQSLEFMTTLGLVPNPVTVDQLVDETLLP